MLEEEVLYSPNNR